MPELPEVEGARKLVERTAVGKRIVKATVAEDEKVINDVSPQDLARALEGRTLLEAKRRGKQMWWNFDAGPSLLLHFGMTGGLVVKGVGAAHYKSFAIDDASWPPRFVKLELEFEDGTQLAFCDARRFAKVRFLAAPESCPPISALGWDPLLDWPPQPEFAAALGGQRRAVKAVLLEQSFSAGVGNWVADEVLYQARVHPEQPANTIPPDQVAALHGAIRDVCQLAAQVDADADRFPSDWLFHYRWGKGSGAASRMPSGHAIEHITVGGRTSAVVTAVQKLDKAAIAAAAGKGSKGNGSGAAAGKKAGGHGKKAAAAADEEAEEAAAGEEKEEAEEVAAATAEAAVAVAQGDGKARGRRSKAAVAEKVGATAAEVAEAAAATKQGKARRGSGAKSFRSQGDTPASAPASGSSAGRAKASGSKASGGKRAAPASGTSGAAVSERRTRARK